MAEPFRAILHRDGQQFLMSRGTWRSPWVPVASLSNWIQLYRRLRDRNAPKSGGPGPYHIHHAPCVDALEALQRKLKETVN